MSRKKDVGLGREFHALMRLHDQIANLSDFVINYQAAKSATDGDIETLFVNIDDGTSFGRLFNSIADYWLAKDFVSHRNRDHVDSEVIHWMGFQAEDAAACSVRSGMKYTTPMVAGEYCWAPPTVPLRLPFPWVTISTTFCREEEESTLLMFAEYRTVKKGYPELDVEPDEQFISVSYYTYQSSNIWPLPVEVHFKLTDDDQQQWISAWLGNPVMEKADTFVDCLVGAFMNWWDMLNSSTAKTTTYRGLKPSRERKIKPVHGRKYPKFEHVVIERDLSPEPDPRGESTARAPGMVRKHFRAGHWRHFSKPLKSGPNKGKTRTWVQDCAPGNAEIGILKTDLVLRDSKEKK